MVHFLLVQEIITKMKEEGYWMLYWRHPCIILSVHEIITIDKNGTTNIECCIGDIHLSHYHIWKLCMAMGESSEYSRWHKPPNNQLLYQYYAGLKTNSNRWGKTPNNKKLRYQYYAGLKTNSVVVQGYAGEKSADCSAKPCRGQEVQLPSKNRGNQIADHKTHPRMILRIRSGMPLYNNSGLKF